MTYLQYQQGLSAQPIIQVASLFLASLNCGGCKNMAESDKLPPAIGALKKRIVCECPGILWDQADISQQTFEEGLPQGHKSSAQNNNRCPIAPKSTIEMVRCQCKTECRTKNLTCNDLCLCITLCNNDKNSNTECHAWVAESVGYGG